MSVDKVSYKQQVFSEYSDEYELIDDVWGLLAKTDDLRKYLPERFNESPNSYKLRLQTTTLPSVFKDSIERGGGRLGKAQVSEDSLDPIKALESNVNGYGKTLDLFVFEVFVEILKKGCCVVLVDTTEENAPAIFQLVPVTSVQNVLIDDDQKVLRLTVAEKTTQQDGYGSQVVKRFKEYLGDQLRVHQEDGDKLFLVDEPVALTDADKRPRGEVYAVWFGPVGSTPWVPPAPGLIQLAKMSIHQMHKVSELDRAETITALPPILRYLPETADGNQAQADIVWDPESVEDIPHGGDIKLAETNGDNFSSMHQRNQDRQAMMEKFVDAYLHEQIRTDFQAAQADNAETSRLELLVKVLQQGFKDCFRFAMMLSDRTYDPATDPGGLILSATAFDRVTDDEIKLLSDTYNASVLPLNVAQAISIQQWRAKGYDVPEPQNVTIQPNAVVE